MDPSRHERVSVLFAEARRLPAARRAAFLEERCAGDAELRRDVETLLAHEGRSTSPSLRTENVRKQVADAATAVLAPGPPPRIGEYRIIRLIGEGGMGAVYEAEQEDPRRRVALKVIRQGMITRSLLQRFRLEAQVLGQLRHPGIARIYEAGTADGDAAGQPYFAMELVEGHPLPEYAAARSLGTRQRLGLIAMVCDALHHAHQKGVIHRDLKPGNILVEEGDPDSGQAPGQPKILDFGVARATDADLQTVTLQTDVGQLVGTLPYMSPEQAGGDPTELDTRSDVYSVGVIAYELLTGQLPYEVQGKLIHEAVRVIRENTPTPISSHNRVLRGDVETIVGKTLEKDKTRRYQSAAALAEDIRRYLHDEPITARPPSALYQARKFARRNKALVTGTAVVFVVLVAGAAISAAFAVREQAQRRRAQVKAETAQRVTDFMVELFEVAGRNAYRGETITAREVLDQGARRIDEGLTGEPEIRAALMNTMGRVYQNLGVYEESARLLTAAVNLRREHSGGKQELARSLFDLGELRHYADDYDAAEARYQEALAIQREVLGPEHPDVARTLDLLGRCKRDQGDFESAERLHREALDLRHTIFGEEHAEMTESLQSMAMLALQRGKLDESEARFEDALEMRRRLLGREHREIPELLFNLGMLNRYQGEPGTAEQYLREALAMSRQFFGDEHHYVAHCLNALGMILNDRGEYDAAEAMYREGLQIYGRLMGPQSREAALALHNLGTLARDREQYDEAEELLRRALALREEIEGPDHPAIANTLLNLGWVLQGKENYTKAEAAMLRAYELREPALGADHFQTVTVVESLANLYDAWDRPQEAQRWRAKLSE